MRYAAWAVEVVWLKEPGPLSSQLLVPFSILVQKFSIFWCEAVNL